MTDVRPRDIKQADLKTRLVTSWLTWMAITILVIALGLLAWIIYWKTWIAPFYFETAHAKCIEYVTEATDEQCRCIAASMVERIGEYFYLDRLLQDTDGLTREEMREIRDACGVMEEQP